MEFTEQKFDSIVAGFYRAATGEAPWEVALGEMRLAFNARAAIIQSNDTSNGRIVQFSYAGDAKPDAALNYVRTWHRSDPRRAQLLRDGPELADKWWHCHEHFDDSFVARSPFYRDFLTAQETRYLATSLHVIPDTSISAFALELPAERGPLTADERHVAQRLSQHFDNALRTHERVRRMASQALAGHTLLNAFAHPMWLIDADRYIFYANTAAQAVEDAGHIVDAQGRRLQWQADRTDAQLAEFLCQLPFAAQGSRTVIDARKRRVDSPTWLHLHVLVPGEVLGAFGDRRLVLATLFDPTRMTQLDPFALAEVFNMTPTEGRVAALLAEGLSAQDISDRLHCALATVRTHLRRVKMKLGADNVATAVRVLRQSEALWTQVGAAPFAHTGNAKR